MPVQTVISKNRLPIKAWLSADDLALQANVIDQASNLANHPLTQQWVALMPDAHSGFGSMPIGGVVATEGGVLVNAVGNDISCFAPETKVPLLDGTQATMQELAERNEDFWVYSIDSSQKIVPGRARALKTRQSAELIEVEISGGDKIICTPDHLFTLRDGTYREASNLHFKDSLMPLYRVYEARDGYERIMHPGGGSGQTHRVVEAYINGPLAVRAIVHHENHNHFDNRPDNLRRMTRHEHDLHHGKNRGAHFRTEEFKANRLAVLREKGFYAPEFAEKKKSVARANIATYMKQRTDDFTINMAKNGQRGKKYLVGVNNKPFPCGICDDVIVGAANLQWHRRKQHNNHSVIAVRTITRRDDVYCLNVDIHHNFALSAGVFVHNCGVLSTRTNLVAGQLSTDLLQKIRLAVHARVPVGNAAHTTSTGMFSQDTIDKDLPIVRQHVAIANNQFGTLGSGNHFAEVQKDEFNRVWLMIHSGSRNMGAKVCDFYLKLAQENMRRFHANIPTLELAFLARGDQTHDTYLAEMQWCVAFAAASRMRMFEMMAASFTECGLPLAVEEQFDVQHNFAAMEHHFDKNLMVHRKGAVRARVGELLAIPGSMGTASYIARGLGNAESFSSSPHGAGRVLSRSQANKQITHARAVASMQHVVYGIRQGSYDECPDAYKDVHTVIQNASDLVEPVHTLLPLAVVKG